MRGHPLLWPYFAILLLAIGLAIVLWKYLDLAGKVLGIMLSATFLVEALRMVFQPESALMNSVILTLVAVGEILGFGLLYLLTIHAASLGRKMLVLSFLLLFLVVGNTCFLQPLRYAQTNLYLFENVLLAAIAVHALYYLSVSSLTQKLLETPAFWFWAMILIYQCSTLSFWGSQQLLKTQSTSVQRLAADLHVVVNIVQYAGMAYGLSLYKRKKYRP